MSIMQLGRVGSTLVALATSMTVVFGCASAADADADQTIYLDPQTGKVIQHPAPRAPSRQSSQRATTGGDGAESSKADGYKRWQTADGTQMLSVDPSQAPKERVVRCADGSLRMGSTSDDGKDNNAPGALCARPAD